MDKNQNQKFIQQKEDNKKCLLSKFEIAFARMASNHYQWIFVVKIKTIYLNHTLGYHLFQNCIRIVFVKRFIVNLCHTLEA